VGKADLALVDAKGRLTLVECKLQKNAGIRRSVIGQILAYGSGLWQMPLTRFEELRAARLGQPLLDDIREAHGSDLDEQSFRRSLGEALAKGRFRLVIAVDEITDEIRRIIEYTNNHTTNDLSLVALELGLFKDGVVELLIPNAYGDELAALKEPASRARWSLDDVTAALEGKVGASAVYALLEHAKTHNATSSAEPPRNHQARFTTPSLEASARYGGCSREAPDHTCRSRWALSPESTPTAHAQRSPCRTNPRKHLEQEGSRNAPPWTPQARSRTF
jgi:hypothetical protein